MPLRILLMFLLSLAGCGSGAVVFAPTPLPPDLSPVAYTHPGRIFRLVAPRTWAVYEQNTTALASAAFSAPGESEPTVLFAVINPGVELDSASFGELINQYQTQIRPDIDRYSEQSRQAMGDGSWRMTGLRRTPLGETQQVNTFIQYRGTLLGIIDVVLPDDPARRQELQGVVNSFEILPEALLASAPLSSLTVASTTELSILHVSNWTTPDGVFFITGEVANYGSLPAFDVPIGVVLRSGDGLNVGEAEDTTMGYGIAPGGFAPFSLRFGQGQPALAQSYDLTLGGETWQRHNTAQIVGPESLEWTSDSAREANGRLVISGTVRNTGAQAVREAKAIVTVFDANQRVIAAGFTLVGSGELVPGSETTYQIAVPEMGGQPANYIVIAQGLV
jgi:hypothetical protein